MVSSSDGGLTIGRHPVAAITGALTHVVIHALDVTVPLGEQ
jgi:hypothetical protein